MDKMDNKISIITICYNAATVIEKTMVSVLEQTYDNMEYIIVDGSSKDETLDIVKDVFSRYPQKQTRYISEPDRGLYDAINKGILMATGEWVNMMNAGDYYVNSSVLENVFADSCVQNYSMIYSDYILRYGSKEVKEEASVEKGVLLHQAIIYRKCLHNLHGFYAVTKPMIASDFLFFCLVPQEQYYKTSTIIASYDMSGLSNQGNWCYLQINCLRYIFGMLSFPEIAKIFLKERIKEMVPNNIWNFYKKIKG